MLLSQRISPLLVDPKSRQKLQKGDHEKSLGLLRQHDQQAQWESGRWLGQQLSEPDGSESSGDAEEVAKSDAGFCPEDRAAIEIALRERRQRHMPPMKSDDVDQSLRIATQGPYGQSAAPIFHQLPDQEKQARQDPSVRAQRAREWDWLGSKDGQAWLKNKKARLESTGAASSAG